MTINEITNAEAVKSAIAEFDQIGRDSFLQKYGYLRSKVYFVSYKDKEYDSKAILGAAHFYQTGKKIEPSEFSGGEPTIRRLNQLGFSVTTHLPDFGKLTKENIDKALAEYDEIGSTLFYAKYSGTPSIKYRIVHNGRIVDAKPVIVAALQQIDEYKGIEPNDVPGNKRTVADPLRRLGFELLENSTVRYWQVMHRKTGQQAEEIGYLFSPKAKENGARNKWYDNMAEAMPGDVVYSYWDKEVHAIGRVIESAITGANPFAGDEFGEIGWLLKVDFKVLEIPFSPKENFDFLWQNMTELDKKSFNSDGSPVMGYLKEISPSLASAYEFLATQRPEISGKKNNQKVLGPSIKRLATELLLAETFLNEIVELLEDKKQTIFYGPPGAGKTYVAMKIAAALAEDEDEFGQVELVQFHPSYAYEDFVEGFRPTESGSFVLKPGKLLNIAKRAQANPDKKFFLIIDEINRGNVAKIFGEMYFLLEYRDRSIQLQYSDEDFKMPENLYFIGTMNSADRSIGLIDSALRRRFHFVSFYPSEDEMKELLRDWLKQNAPEVVWVADAVDEANKMLNNPDFAIGPSHFMKLNLNEELVKKIWQRSILPYVEDIFFNRKEEAQKYELDRLRALKRLAADQTTLEIEEDDQAASA